MNTKQISSRESIVESPEPEFSGGTSTLAAKTAAPNGEVSYQFVVTVGQLAAHAKDYRVANCIMAAVRDELRQPKHGYGSQVHVSVNYVEPKKGGVQ